MRIGTQCITWGSLGMKQNETECKLRGTAVWPTRKEDPIHNFAWRLFRIRDERRDLYHVLAVGTQESGDMGRERIDLVAFRVDTDGFGDSSAREEVCSMSAHRSFGLTRPRDGTGRIGG